MSRRECRIYALHRQDQQKLGETNINVLTLAVIYDGVAFPILFVPVDAKKR